MNPQVISGLPEQPTPAPETPPDFGMDEKEYSPDPSNETNELKQFISEVNIAEHLDEKELLKIGQEAHAGYENDLKSRKVWEENLDNWTKLALQVKEIKTWPWPRASNVKYPLLSTAAMQFAARAYPALVPANGQVVKAKVIGYDPDGKKAARAERVGKHMSYQVMDKMCDWEDDMDKLLIILPIVGTCFKKSFWDGNKKEIVSKLVLPKDLVVNYWSSSLEGCERKTERMHVSRRLVKERQLQGIWLDVDLAPPQKQSQRLDRDRTENTRPAEDDETTPYLILEQHTFLDLDDDGYPEPYIVVFEEKSKKVLRISARFDDDGIEVDEKNKVVKITPVEYYTKYGFIPNPDGGFYDLGFGLLLGTLNDSVNTIINQLIDAGTLSNMQSGFIAKGLRIKMGDARFQPGEWKSVNATADDLHKQIVPMPVREPSNVLFQLLGTLVTSAKELASVAEIFVGKMPGQNTPATTTMATIDQGMKVFTAIYKRVYRSLDKEFKKLYRLNRLYLDPKEEQTILDLPVSSNDYEDASYDICPAADPSAISQSEKLAKFEQALQLMNLQQLDPKQMTLRGLEAYEIPNPQQLMAQGPPPPSPEQQKAQVDMQVAQQTAQLKQQEAQLKMQLAQAEAEYKQRDHATQLAMKQQMQAQELQYKEAIAALEYKIKSMDVQAAGVSHVQNIQQKDEVHKQKLQQMKESKPNDQK